MTGDVVEVVQRRLGDIPNLFALLPVFVEPGSLPPDPDARRGSTNPSKPPVVLEVVDLTDTRAKPHGDDDTRDVELDRRAGGRRLGVLPTLSVWVGMFAPELDDAPCTRDFDVPDACEWLARHADVILDQCPDFAVDVEWLWSDLRRAVGERDPLVFSCPKCGWRIEPVDGGAWFRCTGCPETWRMDAELRRLGALQEMTLKQIASMRGLALKTLHDWSARGWIAPIGRSPRGFLYDVGRVDALIESGKVRQKHA